MKAVGQARLERQWRVHTCPIAAPDTQHSVLIWFALQCGKAKQYTVICDYDHIPVSWGCMQVQYPLLMAP